MIRNNYHPSHEGTQPVRVLQHSIIAALEKTNQEFLDRSHQLIKLGQLHPGITYHINREPIKAMDSNRSPKQMPYLLGGKVINIHETFLSYLWCMSYVLITLYEEQVAKPDQNRQAGNVVYQINKHRVDNAYALFEYARSIVIFFDDWDLSLPNPEIYNETEAQWIETINGVYSYAITFILQHEFSHSFLGHRAKKDELKSSGATQSEQDALSRKHEWEADNMAIDALRRGYRLEDANGRVISTELTSQVGNLVGLCSLIFLSVSISSSTSHPSLADRIDSLIQTLQLTPESQLWGVACVAFQLWSRQFGYTLALPTALDEYQGLYKIMLAEARKIK
ncbi:hypothetical protein H8B13_08960 [Hymenobacter sp. BT188]|uniref:hypothetical protein n=1 Tax=Hymenobacter sp. BT188 TaxID=2763504 RepID=UPI0016510292|nr:hypothetical protein [Hymenobacter sp. BT188]MBC6606945.1 hypothetical protein [Hymenobacter sp. BT188]